MSEKSDEELEGDVDNFDMDFDGDDKTKKKETLTSKAGFKKTQVVPENPKGKDVQDTVKRPEPVLTGQKKPNMKRKTPATAIPAGDDLLQAFAIGLPSIKKASPAVNVQKKTNVVSKKVNSQSPATALFGEKGKKAPAKENTKQEAKVDNSKKNIETDSVLNTPEVKNVPVANKQEQIKKTETDGKEKTNLPIEEKKPSEINVSQNKQDSHVNDRTNSDLKQKDSLSVATKKDQEVVKKPKLDDNKAKVEPKTSQTSIGQNIPPKKSQPDSSHKKGELVNKQKKSAPVTVTSHKKQDVQIKHNWSELNASQKKADINLSYQKSEADISQNKTAIENSQKTQESCVNVTGTQKKLDAQLKPDISQKKTGPDNKIKPNANSLRPMSDATKQKIESNHLRQKKNTELRRLSQTHEKQTLENSSKSSSSSSSSSKTSSLKRKTDDAIDDISSAKVKKEEQLKEEEKYVELTEENYKDMDNILVEEMLKAAREKGQSRTEVKYVVQVSPLEISDLAQPSIQQIVTLHPTTTLIFKHQAMKFRKKKGFAEATFSTMTELKEFVYQLTQIKVFEKKIEVAITASRPNQAPDVLSFVIHLNRNTKLLKLIAGTEDPMINKPVSESEGQNNYKIQYERVPASSNGAFMHSLFPFTNNVIVTKTQVGKETDPKYHGPLSVFYINGQWGDAVMECCTDFTVNGYSLTKVDTPPAATTDTKWMLSKQDKRPSVAESDEDDLVSSMTRDVCADMLDTIQKLKALGSDNPNMKKILEMQKQLNELQKSLTKPKGPSSTKDKEEKKGREAKTLEEIVEEADRVEQQKDEQIKQQRELEMQRQREANLKRKSMWARKVISDYKQEGVKGDKMSEEAEQFLKNREQRMKDRDEEKKRQVEMERRKAEEKLKQKELEERREAERLRLIRKIEETRLRDSQKTKEFSASQLAWNPSRKSASPVVASGSGGSIGGRHAAAAHARNWDTATTTMDQRPSPRNEPIAGTTTTTSVTVMDEGVDDRLASFELELAEQGKIERRMDRTPPPSIQQRDYHSDRDTFQDLLVITEETYHNLWAQNQIHTLPANFQVRLINMINRLCPVHSCPAKTIFKSRQTFMEHWSIFHTAETTMRFCQKCSAYFMTLEELEHHINRHHQLSPREAAVLVGNARIKVIANPSYRDPSPFVLPSLSV